jgi:alkanesulfonate monooxygenase SsuD/methylene tetrahydromethanopterin reductase-like flavin-dependent oxidoreductase (luciferase family)
MILGYELPGTGFKGPVRSLVTAAGAAEAGGVDYLVLDDRPAARPAGTGAPWSMVTAALLAAKTTRVGLVTNAAIAYCEPYHLARTVASLDHISHGRSGWQAISEPDPAADANHRREGVDPAVGRDARAAEFIPLVQDLWDTWEDGAFIHDKATGRFIDPARIHTLASDGQVFKVRGPLNVVRPPQGHPVVFAPAADRQLAPAADVLTVGDPESAATARQEAGSRPVVAVVSPFVAETEAYAHELHARAGAPASDAARGVVVGDELQVAARLAGWIERGLVDGFTLRFPPSVPLETFTDLVLPRLRADERLRNEFAAADTLRGRFGLSRPANRIVERSAAAGTTGG